MIGYQKAKVSPFSLILNSEQDIINNQVIIDFDTTTVGGDITFNLPAIQSIFFGTNAEGFGIGGGADTFSISGTIIGTHSVIISTPSSGGIHTDKICGAGTTTLTGEGTAFKIWISGLNNWGLVSNKI